MEEVNLWDNKKQLPFLPKTPFNENIGKPFKLRVTKRTLFDSKFGQGKAIRLEWVDNKGNKTAYTCSPGVKMYQFLADKDWASVGTTLMITKGRNPSSGKWFFELAKITEEEYNKT